MITYKEFKRQVKAINRGFEVDLKGCYKQVEVCYEGTEIALIGRRKMYDMYITNTKGKTVPLEERGEPKKYYYRLSFNVHHGNYLNFDTDEGVYYSTKKQLPGIQTQFTREEYAAIAKEHGIPDGYHIEVEVTE